MMFVRIHFAVEEPKRQTFADAFSGLIDEASIPLLPKQDGISYPYYDGNWYGASQQFTLEIAEGLRESLAASECWYLAHYVGNSEVGETNVPNMPTNRVSFIDFIDAVGLEYVPYVYP